MCIALRLPDPDWLGVLPPAMAASGLEWAHLGGSVPFRVKGLGLVLGREWVNLELGQMPHPSALLASAAKPQLFFVAGVPRRYPASLTALSGKGAAYTNLADLIFIWGPIGGGLYPKWNPLRGTTVPPA